MIQVQRTIIESLGSYLPPKEVTTAEIMAGCACRLNMPLERLTGIQTRRRAGQHEFAIDLAEKAVRDCLSRSRFRPEDIDFIVSTNISRWDGHNQVFFEPPTSCRLKQRLGLTDRAIAVDISNACAGMWTGVYLVDALIRSGEIRCGIVVSGEYITHLIDTAQKEVSGFMDSQLASLTLGDAGVAICLTRGNSDQYGLMDFELYTLSKYSRFCIAKPTEKAHGGAAMLTDAIRVTEAVIPHAARHAKEVLRRNQWSHDRVQHVIPHQTSELTMKAGIREMRRLLDFDYSDRLISNLRHRGNTSSNAHFLALHDAIQEETINAGDSVVFCISGSGQSTGTALYVLDDLPERMRSPTQTNELVDDQDSWMLPLQLEIESWGITEYPLADEPDTVQLIAKAAENCFASSTYQRDQIDLFIAACTYRSEFLMEPAIAALAAGELRINDDRNPEDESKTFAFDVVNGEVGFLKSVYLAAELTRAGRVARTLVAASEVENNITRRPDHLLGVRSMASAVVLREAQGERGFLAFSFKDYTEHASLREVHAGWHEGGRRVYLTCDEQPQTWEVMQKCLVWAIQEFLAAQGYTPNEIDWFLPTQYSSESNQRIAAQLGIDQSKLIDLEPDRLGNPLSSLFPLALSRGMTAKQFKPGDKILIASVCPGLQVGCAIYRM